jgi:hypothetical protein
VPTHQVEIIDPKPPEVHALEPEEVVVEDLGAKEFSPHINPLLPGAYPFPLVQVPPPRSDLVDSIPLHWDTMDDTMPMSMSRVPVTPTMMIVTRGILPPSVSSQMNVVNQSSVVVLTKNIPSLVIGPTQAMSATTSLLSTTNSFLYGMSSMDVLNTLPSSQSTSHVSSVSQGNTSSPYQEFPWGKRSYSSIFPIHWEYIFLTFWP